MVSATETFETLLKAAGFSITAQRREIFAALRHADPLTLRELATRVNGTVDRASVYRTVALFERLGIVRRITIGWKYKLELGDRFLDHHHHFTCVACHTVRELGGNEIEQLVANLGQTYDFVPLEHQIELQGLCTKCRQR